MRPTPSDVHVNRPLTSISIAYLQSASSFIASRVFPTVPVAKQSDRYFQYDRGEFNRAMMEKRAPGTESAGSSYKLDSNPSYFCDIWALHKDIPDEVRANADQPLAPDREATEWLTLQALLRKEKLWASRYFAASLWGTEYTGVNSGPTGSQFLRWNDAASNPIEDIRAGATAMHIKTGFRPNKLTLGRQVYDKLVDHPDIIDRVKYGQTPGSPATVNKTALAQLFEIDEVLVMDAIENTAAEGQAASHSLVGGKHALLTYSPGAPGIMTASAGYTFAWNGMAGVGPEGNRISTFRMDPIKSDRAEIEMCFDLKLVAADLGVFFATAVA